ncbi:phage tail assembly chaperone [Pseudomonas entomophila]|uniref:phage tail assembly chaperone n=1 Tax=Pseudomonas entomophila TaxID=312306 RepID=UPI0023D7C38D|nr:phage tail assembly chaperone [Pseudomonas entomophila]MDF0732328.1 phage tail assembly chaperone [Pseudomonas entomophila]
MTIYLIDAAGQLHGPVELLEVPGLGQQMPSNAIELVNPLPVAEPGYVWGLVDAVPQQLPDHRGAIYRTDTGQEEQFEQIGPLPDGFTTEPFPGQFHIWSGDAWVIDQSAQLDAALLAERVWRNARIAESDYLAMPDYPISPEQRGELYAYRQALRNWPQTDAFPDSKHRPMAPAWMTALPL